VELAQKQLHLEVEQEQRLSQLEVEQEPRPLQLEAEQEPRPPLFQELVLDLTLSSLLELVQEPRPLSQLHHRTSLNHNLRHKLPHQKIFHLQLLPLLKLLPRPNPLPPNLLRQELVVSIKD